MTPTNDSGRGVLALPLRVQKTRVRNVFAGDASVRFDIFDANDSSLGIDFEESTAQAIVTACNDHAALTARVAELTWRPIETAPKDGREIWVSVQGRYVAKAWLFVSRGDYWEGDSKHPMPTQPDHWMPYVQPSPAPWPSALSPAQAEEVRS